MTLNFCFKVLLWARQSWMFLKNIKQALFWPKLWKIWSWNSINFFYDRMPGKEEEKKSVKMFAVQLALTEVTWVSWSRSLIKVLNTLAKLDTQTLPNLWAYRHRKAGNYFGLQLSSSERAGVCFWRWAHELQNCFVTSKVLMIGGI